MGNKNSKSVFKHSEINNNIVDSINKMQSINLFTKEVLSEDQEYNLLKETKSDNFKISQKATDKISRSFSKFAFKLAKIKFNTIGKKIDFEDLARTKNLARAKKISLVWCVVCCGVLCHAMYTVVCCGVLWCAVAWCAVLCFGVGFSAAVCFVLCRAVPCCVCFPCYP